MLMALTYLGDQACLSFARKPRCLFLPGPHQFVVLKFSCSGFPVVVLFSSSTCVVLDFYAIFISTYLLGLSFLCGVHVSVYVVRFCIRRQMLQMRGVSCTLATCAWFVRCLCPRWVGRF